MKNSFEFSNWNQLSGLRSSEYPLIIHVTQYNSSDLVGTLIKIVDTHTDDVYFSGFVRIFTSTILNSSSVFTPEDMVEKINSYGFNIKLIPPLELQPNVICILEGLKSLGYNYVTLEYKLDTERELAYTHSLPEYQSCKSISKHLVASEDLVNSSKYYIISNSPEFNWEDFKWVEFGIAYSIELLLNPKGE